jgi:hypothetical protein
VSDENADGENPRRQRQRSANDGGRLRSSTTANFSKNLPLEDAIADAAKKLAPPAGESGAAEIQVADVAALLRYVNRQISI